MGEKKGLEQLIVPKVEIYLPDSSVIAHDLQTDLVPHRIKPESGNDSRYTNEDGYVTNLTLEEHNKRLGQSGRFTPSLPTVCSTVYVLLCQGKDEEAIRLLRCTTLTGTIVNTKERTIVHDDPVIGKTVLTADLPPKDGYVHAWLEKYEEGFRALMGLNDVGNFCDRLASVDLQCRYWGPGHRDVMCGTNSQTGSWFGLYTCRGNGSGGRHPAIPFQVGRVERRNVQKSIEPRETVRIVNK